MDREHREVVRERLERESKHWLRSNLVEALDHIEAQERRIEELENAARMADGNIGWVTDASADRHVKEVLRKALG